ncbi:hypothetical protein RUMCAL_02529 [Ruminococcus callidus ATCC 27760]|uniref:Uncharacterized protein n=1 Tax=Ruminococcus callidus ATCC 27760 TaxID=411473 RepID=U2LXI8_9FIRM|nr:hypothetical protein [Ruminococcus callidus]ERJ91818.1 hypothetical protein RUMCAL_02529 [Ruminococcus callidus ATCC 27760]
MTNTKVCSFCGSRVFPVFTYTDLCTKPIEIGETCEKYDYYLCAEKPFELYELAMKQYPDVTIRKPL